MQMFDLADELDGLVTHPDVYSHTDVCVVTPDGCSHAVIGAAVVYDEEGDTTVVIEVA